MTTLAPPARTAIRQLPPSVVNKIAAGEVIERPASVVKELLENAVDAGATRIDVTVEQGGMELIRVVDDGCGIAAAELPLAVASHATSKIDQADDLFRVRTLGFRGEALASIAEISRVVLRSRTADETAAAELEITGGRLGDVAPCGAPPGTSVEVHQLFFNTPVRRKFLRATQTEMGHTTEAFTRLALAYPPSTSRSVTAAAPFATCPRRATSSRGSPASSARSWPAIYYQSKATTPACGCLVMLRRPQPKPRQRANAVPVPQRPLDSRSRIAHALGEAYRGLLLSGRYPICFLQIAMPPEDVDVNVHPTKLEVRFQDSGRLYSQLLGTLRTKFLTVDLTTRLQPASPATEAAAAHDPTAAQSLRGDLVAWARGQLASQQPPGQGGTARADDDQPEFTGTRREPLSLVTLDRTAAVTNRAAARPLPSSLQPGAAAPPPAAAPTFSAPAASERPRHPPADPFTTDRSSAIQVHNRYLIAETDEGMVVIDQHALHERILYEQIREKVLAGSMECQRLLVPEPVDLGPTEAAAVLSAQETLAHLGVHVEPFGGDTVLITSYPAMLANFRPVEVLRELVDKLLTGGKVPEHRDLLDELLHMISCKAAIKAGDRLSQEEIAALVEQRACSRTATTAPTAAPHPSSSPARSWIDSSCGRKSRRSCPNKLRKS